MPRPGGLTGEELQILRREAADFIAAVQNLNGFAERIAALDPPAAGRTLPWWSICRLLSDPTETPPGTGVISWDGSIDDPGVANRRELPRPGYDDLEQIAAYAERLRSFSQRYLAGPEWGPRAVHDALRLGAAIRLPHRRPTPLVNQPGAGIRPDQPSWVNGSRARPRSLRGNREKTWGRAIAAIEARLNGRRALRRDAVADARRYLNAAVNREIAGPESPVDPAEPSDDPLYEQKARRRIESRLSMPNP